MDIRIEYIYGIGSVDNVIKGVGKDIITGKDPEELLVLNEARKKDSGIITIDLMGVYQKEIPIGENYVEKSILEQQPAIPDKINQMKNKFINDMIRREKEVEDKFHPDLIQIAYDPSYLNRGLVNSCLQDNLRRIKIVPYDELTDPYKKDTFFVLDPFRDAKGKERSEEKIQDILKNIISSFRDNLINFGLTREEYLLLVMAQYYLEPEKGESKLIKDKGFINAFYNFLEERQRTEKVK
jgi:hypothetical protein